jgi:preprotein translocase subunit SecA
MIKLISSYFEKSAIVSDLATVSKINNICFDKDVDFKKKTDEFKLRYQNGESMSSLLPEAFALCRLASQMVLGLRHYDVQLSGGIALYRGLVAEINTGEGKTLIATLPAYLSSISGTQVHIVTVNDYLAERDCGLMEPLYNALGVTVDYIKSSMDSDRRKLSYACDVVYVTSNELGFDYLRDNMAKNPDSVIQNGQHFAIIDEVDSILIDDARTPLIISGATNTDEKMVMFMRGVADKFNIYLGNEDDETLPDQFDVFIDEKSQSVQIANSGYLLLENCLLSEGVLDNARDLYKDGNLIFIDACVSAIKAKKLYKKNEQYIVLDGKVKIVSQNTGRVEEGRRWSGGLHQAIEAKEDVRINPDNISLATVSLQNYFRMYKVLSGMSGTAYSEREEFLDVYGLKVVRIKSHKPCIRKDLSDIVFATRLDKIRAILKDIRERNAKGQPVLVGTSSIQESDYISKELSILNIDHKVLSAKHNYHEAFVIAGAGKPGAVTIATNMAGRGTDILLGGNLKEWIDGIDGASESEMRVMSSHWHAAHKQVLALGGLHIIGTERNDSRRIDDQLIGRAGRQGDPGSSRFYLSFEDKLFRIFGDSQQKNFEHYLSSFGGSAVAGISHPFLDKAIFRSQRRIDDQHFTMRKELLKYDDVLNSQRSEIYSARQSWLFGSSNWDKFREFYKGSVEFALEKFMGDGKSDFVNESSHKVYLRDLLRITSPLEGVGSVSAVRDILWSEIDSWERNIPLDKRNEVITAIALYNFDIAWSRHLQNMESLRAGIMLRVFASKTPVQEYTKEGYASFGVMLEYLKLDILEASFRAFGEIKVGYEVVENESR